MLGYDQCHHMEEVRDNPHQAEVFASWLKGAPVCWNPALSGYCASCDWPSVYFWSELVDSHPTAKVIHTERNPDQWLASMKKTIFQAIRSFQTEPAATRGPAKQLIL
ncbi:MAG: sulfotransferase, partial [Pseudomonadota bacterium]